MQPLVSVVIPSVPGREKYLQRAIQSVKNQTYKNIEIITVVDDTINSNQARNRGIKLAKGDIFLIDTPGVIPFDEESEVELVLRGAIRPDKIYHLLDAVDKILSIVSKDELFNKYGINYTNTNEFLEKMAYKRGRLGAKGIADIKSAAKILINDFQRGRIKYYFDPPK